MNHGKAEISVCLSPQTAWKNYLARWSQSFHWSIMFQARRWKFKFTDKGEVRVRMKPLGQKARSYGQEQMVAKLGETYAKREGEEFKRMEAPVRRDSSGCKGSRHFVECEGQDLSLNKYWSDRRYINTMFPFWPLANCWHVCEMCGKSLNSNAACKPDSWWDFSDKDAFGPLL